MRSTWNHSPQPRKEARIPSDEGPSRETRMEHDIHTNIPALLDLGLAKQSPPSASPPFSRSPPQYTYTQTHTHTD